MKKLLTILCTSLLLVFVSCEKYEAILERLNDLEQRIEDVESQCRRLNSNIEGIHTILTAIQKNDYVTDVMKIMEEGIEVGYSITFANGGTVNIYHGADGTDGTTPDIGIRKASDGAYYWTSNGEWMTSEDGEMIPATVTDPDGGYIVPHFRIADGIWYVSYDNGNSWRQIEEVEKKSEAFFKDVQYDGEYICFTLLDDTKVIIPCINKVNNHWAGKTWYAYGTSLTSKSQGKYVPYVAEMGGLNVVNKGIGGGGIITNTKIRDAVMNTTDGKLSADLITLEVGANDASAPLGDPLDNTADTFLGSLTQCINYLLQNTNAQIVVMSSTIGKYKSSGGSTEVTEENSKFLERCKGIREVCIKCGVYYIGLADEAGMGWARLNNNMGVAYTTDNIHHTDIGGYNLALYVWSRLKDIPCWYTSVPEDGDNSPSHEGGTHIVDKSWVAEAVSGLPKDTEAASLLGTQYFYVSDEACVDYIEGKTIGAMWFSIATSGSQTTHPGGDVNIYLVDLSDPAPTSWILKDVISVPASPVLTFKTMSFNTPFKVPEGYTIGWQSSAKVIGHTKNGSKKPAVVANLPCSYYNKSDSATSTDIVLSGIDFKITQ